MTIPMTIPMTIDGDGLVEILTPRRIADGQFEAPSQDLERRAGLPLFGGQLLGQALGAASHGVDSDKTLHSFFAQFVRGGDVAQPVRYAVQPQSDGRSFATRRVVASQAGRELFHLMASFHRGGDGPGHQDEPPVAPPPAAIDPQAPRTQAGPIPFEMRPHDDPDGRARRLLWVRAHGVAPTTSPTAHLQLFAYASEYFFASTALLPHGLSLQTPGLQVITVSHACWVFGPRPPRVDRWHLHAIESPRAANGRAFIRSTVFTASGALVASVTQEVLVRRGSTPRPRPQRPAAPPDAAPCDR